MCSKRIEIEKNTSKEGERSVQIVHGSGEIDQQNVIMHKAYLVTTIFLRALGSCFSATFLLSKFISART